MNRYFILIISLFISISTFSQSKRTEKADAYFESGEYYKATTYFEKAYSKAKSRPEKAYIAYHLGFCYKRMNKMRDAQVWLRRSVIYKYQNPISILYLADVLKITGQYEDAAEFYANYKELVPNDYRATIGIESCKQIPQWIEKPTRYQVANENFINSKQSDFSISFRKDYDEIIFSSTREGTSGTDINNASGEYFADIFKAKKDKKGKWSEAVPFGENINSEFDEGSPSLNIKGNTMYFTRCFIDENGFGACKIFESTRSGTSWSVAKKLDLLKDTSISIGHPAISPDELSLYFVAEMEGGKGGKDIWKVTRTSNSTAWGRPVNIGSPVNTPGDEMFPTIKADGTLYFSSNYPIGMGGLDIFKLEVSPDGKQEVVNLKYPINSETDDFGIIFEGDNELGYFCSTRREGSKGGDDIWSFVLPPLAFSVDVIVLNDETEQALIDADVRMLGSDGTAFNKKTDNEGRFKFKLKGETDYVMVTNKTRYLNGKERVSTRGLKDDETFALEIRMSPIEIPIALPNILYDFDAWQLRPESMVALDELVETLDDNPNITIELSSHTDYVGAEIKNDSLSQKRAQSVVDYLISKKIASDRLVAKGYGESTPKTINSKLDKTYSFLHKGNVLREAFIKRLSAEEQEIANQINRRTEFKVLTIDYKQK